jgi:hypothetical protein
MACCQAKIQIYNTTANSRGDILLYRNVGLKVDRTYSGDVIADSKGASHSDVGVVVSKLDRSTVRVTSDDRRLDTVDVSLTRSGNQILNADGDTPFIVDLDRNPPSLLFNPHSEVAYRGNKQK